MSEHTSQTESLTDVPGPANGIAWVFDEERLRAKQQEQLVLDEQYAMDWVATMRDLVAQRLSDGEFVDRRMELLKRWEKARKRDQHNLHYKYDPRRRNPKLVERDSRRQLASMEAKAERAQAALADMRLDTRLSNARPIPQRPAQRASNPSKKELKLSPRMSERELLERMRNRPAESLTPRPEPIDRDLMGVPQDVLDDILDHTTIINIAVTSDAELLAALLAAGRDETEARAQIEIINGK